MFSFELVPLIQSIGYPGIAAIIFAETGTIIGFILPGASLLFTAGLLAAHGYLDIHVLIPLLIIAATLGDNVGYLFGAKVGIHVFDRPDSRLFKHHYLQRTRRFYAQHGPVLILFARFIPMVRTFAPILAGVAGMQYRLFMWYNVLGAVIWVTSLIGAGYILGDRFPRSIDYLEQAVLVAIVISSVPVLFNFVRTRVVRIKIPKLIMFDLDGTLAPPFSEVSPVMTAHIGSLLSYMPVGIVSAATFDRIESSLLHNIPDNGKGNLYILSANGAIAHLWQHGAWHNAYDESLSPDEYTTIRNAIHATIASVREFASIAPEGEQIIERGGYVAFTAPGIDASREKKTAWDPSALKRHVFIKGLKKILPGYDVYVGGATSVDIMRKGFNKAHAVRWTLGKLGLAPEDALFVGDALYPGGNDFSVTETKVRTKQVAHPGETQDLIDDILKEIHSDSSRK